MTSLSGLYLLYVDESKIYADPEITAALDAFRPVSLDDMMPPPYIKQTLSMPDTLIVVHNSTEGSPSHVNDIKSHHELYLADVLCLTETLLQGSFVAESLHLQGYSMFKCNRHLSYTDFPQMAYRGGGGVAVYVRSCIQVHERKCIQHTM